MNIRGPRWGEFGGWYALPEKEVHVWRTTLDMAPFGFAKFWQILAPDERERADRFHFERDRRRAVIARGYLRLLLGQFLDLPPNKLVFEYDEFGKPGLLPEQGSSVQFNVSHSGDLILIAIARSLPVGVDVERIRTDLDVADIAARFFSANENELLASLGGALRYKAFFNCWTRKEAYLKARGIGLSLPLDQFDVSFLPGEEPRLLATRPDPAEASQWRVRALDLSGDYAAALAAPNSKWGLKCWDWDPLILVDGAKSA
jgi:4'-phosphopantetheinyl transferase